MADIKKNSFKAWFLAARPYTLVASAAPVLIASALAFHDGYFTFLPALICFIFAVVAQIISNFANDYFDFKKGSDGKDRIGPKRAVAEGWISPKNMLYATIGLLILDGLLGLSLAYYRGWELILLGIFIGIFALAYSGGPYPLAYHGWGDVCVLIFFGIVPVGFTYYVLSSQWTTGTTLCGIAAGLVIINILVANNYRDRETDKEAKKYTSIVIFGEKFGNRFYLINGIIAVLCCQYFWFSGAPLAAILPLVYLVFHIQTWKEMVKIYKGKELIAILVKTARNVCIFTLLLITGLLL